MKLLLVSLCIIGMTLADAIWDPSGQYRILVTDSLEESIEEPLEEGYKIEEKPKEELKVEAKPDEKLKVEAKPDDELKIEAKPEKDIKIKSEPFLKKYKLVDLDGYNYGSYPYLSYPYGYRYNVPLVDPGFSPYVVRRYIPSFKYDYLQQL